MNLIKESDLKKTTKRVHMLSFTFLYGIRILTNVLITPDLREKLLENTGVNKKIIDFLLTFSDA